MGTLHKRTHRPLAIVALFALLGLVGWQLPQLGRAALAYSNHAFTAARAAITNAPAAKAEGAVATQAAKSAVATTTANMADTPGQQAIAQARAALDAAKTAGKNKSNPSKNNSASLDQAYQNYNAAVALRLSEIRARLAQLQGAGAGDSATDSGSGPNLPAEYQTLLAEVESYGGFPQDVGDLEINTVGEVEPNDTAATATPLTGLDGATQTLVVGTGAITSGNEDWWRITGVPAGARIWAFVDTGGSTGSRDSILELRDAAGTTLIEEDDDGATATNCTTTILSTAASAIANRMVAAAGTYNLRVDSFSSTASITAYKLYVVVTTASSAEVESNNTTGLADSITPSAPDRGRVRTGAIGSGADVDFYSVTVAANSTLHVNLDADPERDDTSTDVIVDIIDTNGTTVLLSIDGTPNFFSIAPESESTCVALASGGTYFIRVRPFSPSDTGTYALMASVASPAGQVCPPTPITSSLGVAGGNFTKVSGTMTQRLFRDGIKSQCGVARTQAAPIAATVAFDRYSITNTGAAAACIFIQLRVVEQAASNYMVGAWLNTFNPANLTQNWLGDPGLSSGIPPTVQDFTVNIPAGQTAQIVVFNTNTTGNGNPYELTVLGFPTCPAPPACAITCPANVTVNAAAGLCSATVTYPAPATTGVCASVTCTPASGTSFPVGTTTVTCTGMSVGGGAPSTCSFTVTVRDTQAPAITCPAPVFVGSAGSTAVATWAAPAVTDNCPNVTAVCVPPSGSIFPAGVTTVTCTATDASANTATCSFPVTVNRVVSGDLVDPLDCTGPGNVVRGSFTATNTSPTVSQVVEATVAMPLAQAGNPQGLPAGYPLLVTLPGTCVASVGTCTVVNSTTIRWTATLAGGQSGTISFQTQVNDQVPTGTNMFVATTTTFNGGASVTVRSGITTTCQAVGPGALFPATSPVSDQNAGSVLVYPVYTSSVGANSQNSRINITNIHPNLRAFLHLYFVADNCAVSDAFLCLTPNQTASFQASDLDPGTTGYLVVVAVDGVTGCPVNFNYLIGDEYVKFSSGHSANLGAEAISAIAGGLPFCNANTVASVLPFDGVSYDLLPTTLAVDNLGSRADGNDTLLVLNAIGGDLRVAPTTINDGTVSGIFGVLYDDAENAFSFTISSSACQFRTILNNNAPRTTPRFEQVIPAGRTGWMRIWHRTGKAILGAALNFNPNANANAGAFSGGHNLHKLTFTPTAVITVPTFPPTC